MEKPLLTEKFSIPTIKIIDWKLITGSSIFGIGWGLCGFCPGPAVTNLFIMTHAILGILGIIGGQHIATYLQKHLQQKQI